jgi:transcription initiation factor TFIIIB Brf1 subunit/transcription initiation factor TFIIB
LKKINLVKHTSGPLKDKYIIIRGNNKISLLASCVYEASLQTQFPLTKIEISNLFQLELTTIYKGDKLFKCFAKKINITKEIHVQQIAKNFLLRFCNEFEYSCEIYEQAVIINKNLSMIEQEIVNNTPGVRAISCLYLAMIILQIDKDKNIRILLNKQYANIFNKSILTKSFKNIKKMKSIITSDKLIKYWIQTCEKIRCKKS